MRCSTNLQGCCVTPVCRHFTICQKLLFITTSASLRNSSELVKLNPIVTAPIRDVNDVIVMQTAIIGEADILCTKDDDFFESSAAEYLDKMGIAVVDDITLMQRLRL